MKKIALLTFALILMNCKGNSQQKQKETFEISKTESEWKQELSDQEFYVLRKAGTERAFTSPLNKENRKGVFVCAACSTPLFKSENKFDSGTGWPSFDKEIKGNVAYANAGNLSYSGIEEHCATCGGHLGHIFNDGPRETTGKRHCINGVALNFIPDNE